ncbi:MAG TPA: hypothetical protein VNK95_00360, partial [Caldilineaceae bacterium]|nr:hypothetical protein [Caldilineaceae bacterium]
MPNHPLASLDSARFAARSAQRYGKIVASLLLCMALAAVLLAGLSSYRVGAAPTQEDKHVYLVVQFDQQARIVRHVQFADVISGLAALQLSGLEVVSRETAFGPAVCSIEGVGCPASDCFCGGDRFWNYSYWDGAGWQSYSVGAGSSVISQTG